MVAIPAGDRTIALPPDVSRFQGNSLQSLLCEINFPSYVIIASNSTQELVPLKIQQQYSPSILILKTFGMKKQITFVLLFLMGLAIKTFAQSVTQDLVVIGAISGDQNMKQVEMRYKGNPQVVFIRAIPLSGVEQISQALKAKQFVDLHVFVKADVLGLYVSDVPLTIANVDAFADQFRLWKDSVSGKMIIHNQTGVTSDGLNELFKKLEALTGLQVVLNQ